MSNLLAHVLSFANLHPAIAGVMLIAGLLLVHFVGLFNLSNNKYQR